MLLLLCIATSFGQQAKKTSTTTSKTEVVNGAGMVFDSEVIDYGTIAQNSNGNREFAFTNNGNQPLIIKNAVGSCGCTIPSYSKEPVAPNGKGKIGVKYATDRVGAFTKTITLTSNAVGQESKTLTIKGVVLAAETAEKK